MARTPVSEDPEVQRLRMEIADRDRAILAAVNDRVRLVAELKRYKERLGVAFADPEQERRLLARLAEANRGPLSDAGVRELFEAILALTKRDLA